jgi:long-subunit fatty acid transport protein
MSGISRNGGADCSSGFNKINIWRFDDSMKKLAVIGVALMLVLAVGAGVWADGKTIYLEYEDEKNVDNYGPTLGIDWEASEHWTLSAGYQLEGDGDNEATASLGVEYAIRENLAAILSCDLADSEDSVCFELSGSHALSEPWALTGGLAYTDYSEEDSADDYHELELAVGAEYQVNPAWGTSLSYVYTDSSEEDADDSKAVIGAEYSPDQYGVYCEYEIPDKADEKLTVGVAYHF